MSSDPVYIAPEYLASQGTGTAPNPALYQVNEYPRPIEVNIASYPVSTVPQPMGTNSTSGKPISVQIVPQNVSTSGPQQYQVSTNGLQQYQVPTQPQNYPVPTQMDTQPVSTQTQNYPVPTQMGIQPVPQPQFLPQPPYSNPAGAIPQYVPQQQYIQSTNPPSINMARFLPPGSQQMVMCPRCNASLYAPLGAFQFLCPCGQLLVNPQVKAGYVPPH